MTTTGARVRRADDEMQWTQAPRRLELVEAEPDVRYGQGTDSAPYYYDGDRRTVVITGQPVPARRRPARTRTQIQARPDRVALWAVGLGVLLILMAVLTANAGPA